MSVPEYESQKNADGNAGEVPISSFDESRLVTGINERQVAIGRLSHALSNVNNGLLLAPDIKFVQHWAILAKAAELDLNSHHLH
jgi:hypothetical protein